MNRFKTVMMTSEKRAGLEMHHHVATNARLEVVMLPVSIWREGQMVVLTNLKLYHWVGFI